MCQPRVFVFAHANNSILLMVLLKSDSPNSLWIPRPLTMTLRIKRMHVFSKPLRLPALRFYLNNYTGKNNLYYYLSFFITKWNQLKAKSSTKNTCCYYFYYYIISLSNFMVFFNHNFDDGLLFPVHTKHSPLKHMSLRHMWKRSWGS